MGGNLTPNSLIGVSWPPPKYVRFPLLSLVFPYYVPIDMSGKLEPAKILNQRTDQSPVPTAQNKGLMIQTSMEFHVADCMST